MSGSYLFVSGFYSGSLMMRLAQDRPAATALWRGENNRLLESGIEVAETTGLHSVMTTPLIVGDHIYGIGSHGQVRGLLAETGERVWEAEGLTTRNRWGSAFFIKHEDRYFVYNENGDLIIVQFNPEGYVELDRTHLLNPTSRSGYGGARPGSAGRARHGQSDRLVVWAHPAFANRHLVLRNDEENHPSVDGRERLLTLPTGGWALTVAQGFPPTHKATADRQPCDAGAPRSGAAPASMCALAERWAVRHPRDDV